MGGSKSKRGASACVVAAALAACFTHSVYAAGLSINDFHDVSKAKWYYTAMAWGVSNGVVAGYKENGTMSLKPDKTVTEAEFLAMLVRMFPNAKSELAKLDAQYPKPAYWADNYYGVAKLFNLPVNGSSSVKLRDTPVSRGLVAQLIAASFGKNYDTNSSIAYLYDTGLSNGRDGKTITGYEAGGLLTRAEAVQFLKMIRDKQMNTTMAVRPPTQTTNPTVTKWNSNPTPAPSPKPAPAPTPAPTSTEQKIQQAIAQTELDPSLGVTKSVADQYVRLVTANLLKSGKIGNNLVLYLPQNITGKNIGMEYTVVNGAGVGKQGTAGPIFGGTKAPASVSIPFVDGDWIVNITIEVQGSEARAPFVVGGIDPDGINVNNVQIK